MNRVSLFDRAGKFVAYVDCRGTPQVIVHRGVYYATYDGKTFGVTRSFREVDGEVIE